MPQRQMQFQNMLSPDRNPMGAGYLSGIGQGGYGMFAPQQALNQSPVAVQMPQPASVIPRAAGGGGSWLGNIGARLGSVWNSENETLLGMGGTGWGNVLQGAGMLGSSWLGMQQLKQGKKEFKFNKGMAERNLANSASLINTQIARRAESNAASLGLEGGGAEAYVEDRKKRESVRGTI